MQFSRALVVKAGSTQRSAGFQPAVTRASGPRKGRQAGRPPDSRSETGATYKAKPKKMPVRACALTGKVVQPELPAVVIAAA